MKEFFKKVNIFKILIALILIVFGICLIAVPNSTILTLCYAIGAFIVCFGIFGIVNYFVYGFEPFGFMNGIFEIAVGTLVMVFAPQITSPQVFSIVAGIIFLFSGLIKIQNSLDCRRFGLNYWWVYMIYALILVTLSIIMMIYPFTGQKIFLIFFGIVLLVDGIMQLFSVFFVNNKIRRAKKKLNEDVIVVDKKEEN